MNETVVRIEPSSRDRLLGELFDPVVRIRMAAMRQPPDHPRARMFGQALEGHVERADFRCRVALTAGDLPIGFGYGYTGRPGYWWTDLVAGALEGIERDLWMDNPFELVELHVHPQWQGRGVGGQLHDAVLAGLPHGKALLSTQRGPTNAFALYRKRGWQTLIERISFPDQNLEYRVMGLDLAARPLRTPAR